MTSGLLSFSRLLALWNYYHAPLSIYYRFEAVEVPRLLNDTGLVSLPAAGTEESHQFSLDLSPLKELNLRLCLGKEWHRFPGHYLVPEGVRVDFVKSEFDGLLPAHFEPGNRAAYENWWDRKGSKNTPKGLNDLNKEEPSYYVRSL